MQKWYQTSVTKSREGYKYTTRFGFLYFAGKLASRTQVAEIEAFSVLKQKRNRRAFPPQMGVRIYFFLDRKIDFQLTVFESFATQVNQAVNSELN